MKGLLTFATAVAMILLMAYTPWLINQLCSACYGEDWGIFAVLLSFLVVLIYFITMCVVIDDYFKHREQ
jgi:uncharacterized membrane protein (DUF485 family)